MDTYQAVYDAVRSRFNSGDVGATIENALRGENIGHFMQMAAESVRQAASAHETPAAVYRPTLSIDGNQWCALYGADLQCGVAGFGDSPALAMEDFDRSWFAKLPERAK